MSLAKKGCIYPRPEGGDISGRRARRSDLMRRRSTKVTGLTIQEIFMTGRKPTFTVALICSRFLAPAVKRGVSNGSRGSRVTYQLPPWRQDRLERVNQVSRMV